jgi:hypothetical protein
MVQSAESREGVDSTLSPTSDRRWSTGWRILRQSEVSPIFMVVAHILGQQPLEVLLIQHDHVVQQVAMVPEECQPAFGGIWSSRNSPEPSRVSGFR